MGIAFVYVHLLVTPNAHEVQHTAIASKSNVSNTLHASIQRNSVHHTVKLLGKRFSPSPVSYNTTVASLKRANANVANLRPGMILLIR